MQRTSPSRVLTPFLLEALFFLFGFSGEKRVNDVFLPIVQGFVSKFARGKEISTLSERI